jgi:hypothetical protein
MYMTIKCNVISPKVGKEGKSDKRPKSYRPIGKTVEAFEEGKENPLFSDFAV